MPVLPGKRRTEDLRIGAGGKVYWRRSVTTGSVRAARRAGR